MIDSRRRRGVRVTLIHAPSLGLVCWVHFAPPLTDGLRKAYRRLLRWNDELPYAKFAISEDERPMLSAEVPSEQLSRDTVGLTVARLLAVCDLLYEESLPWLRGPGGPLGRKPRADERPPDEAGVALLERYAERLGELGRPSQ